MPTQRETILTALADLLRTVPHVPVLRGEVLPERISPAGLMILRDGNPGEPGVTLSPLTYHFQHRSELEVIVQSATDRDAVFDALLAQIGAVILACPVTWRPHPEQITAAQRGYEDWCKALAWVRDGLVAGCLLRDVEVTAAMPKVRPWKR